MATPAERAKLGREGVQRADPWWSVAIVGRCGLQLLDLESGRLRRHLRFPARDRRAQLRDLRRLVRG